MTEQGTGVTSVTTKPGSIKAGWVTLQLGWAFLLLPIPVVSGFFASLFLSISFIVSIVVICQGYAGTVIGQILLNIIVSPILWFISIAFMAAMVGNAGV